MVGPPATAKMCSSNRQKLCQVLAEESLELLEKNDDGASKVISTISCCPPNISSHTTFLIPFPHKQHVTQSHESIIHHDIIRNPPKNPALWCIYPYEFRYVSYIHYVLRNSSHFFVNVLCLLCLNLHRFWWFQGRRRLRLLDLAESGARCVAWHPTCHVKMSKKNCMRCVGQMSWNVRKFVHLCFWLRLFENIALIQHGV